MAERTVRHIGDLTPDPSNARRHTERNLATIERSLREVGAARSIVIDENGVVLAGNGLIEAAAAAGIERMQVVESDGETIIAVRRSNLSPEQKQRLALFDNRSSELAEWDTDVLAAMVDAGADMSGLWSEGELARLIEQPSAADWDTAMDALPDGEKSPFQQMNFTVSDEQAEIVKDALARAKAMGHFVDTGNENSNGNALARICEMFRA